MEPIKIYTSEKQLKEFGHMITKQAWDLPNISESKTLIDETISKFIACSIRQTKESTIRLSICEMYNIGTLITDKAWELPKIPDSLEFIDLLVDNFIKKISR